VEEKMQNNRGYYLLEACIATLILAIVLSALVVGLIQCYKLSTLSRQQDIVANAAQTKLEEIANNTDYSTILNYNTQTDLHTFAINGILPVTGENNPGTVDVVQLMAGAAPTNLFEVTITVRWQISSGPRLERQLRMMLVRS
jgi:Tfp pilus assembly protein PilV